MALLFGASDSVSVASQNIYDSAVGTVSVWIRTTVATTNASFMSRHDGANSSRNGLMFFLNATLGKVSFWFRDSSNSTIWSYTSTASVTDGNWHNIVGVWNQANGSTSTLYVNGVQDGTVSAPVAWTFNGQPIVLGRDPDTFWAAFTGSIGEFAWWNAQLTAAEIAALGQGLPPYAIRPTAIQLYLPLTG